MFYLLSLRDYHYKEITVDNPLSCQLLKNPSIQTYYSIPKKGKTSSIHSMLPVLTGKFSKLKIIGDQDGVLNAWSSMSSNYTENQLKYHFHGGALASLDINTHETKLVSCGVRDGMIVESLLPKFF